MSDHLCKDKKQAEKDAGKADERRSDGKTTYVCAKCGRPSHKEDHLCKPEKAKK